QSTGQTSTQLLSLTPMHGWAITYATAHRSSPGFPGSESGCATDPLRTAHALVVDELAGSPSIASVVWTRRTNAPWSGATIARHGCVAKREVIVGEAATGPRDTIGMTAEEMHAYLEVLLAEEAAEAAAARGTTVEEELESAGFAAARAASSYAIKLLDANNNYIARYLLDRGVFSGDDT
ncbi:MAG: hypothetical protein K0R44_1406, partial [Thermomicrobiales bacterium]|nr:hypothetical protein [Thermomicrobiales bacterium]